MLWWMVMEDVEKNDVDDVYLVIIMLIIVMHREVKRSFNLRVTSSFFYFFLSFPLPFPLVPLILSGWNL